MALSWTSSLQDLVALSVVQKAYTDLRAHEKTFLDGTASVPTSAPGGVAGQALNVVGQYAQWFAQSGASAANAPSVWEHVLVAETAWRFALGIKPSDAPTHRQAVNAAWESAIDSYSVADASANTLNDQSVHVQMIRFHVIRHCLRRSGRRRLYVPVPDIDNAINWAIDYIWYFGAWNFRTRHCPVTLQESDSGADPLFDLVAGEEYHSFVSQTIALSSPSSVAGRVVKMLSAEDFNRVKTSPAVFTATPTAAAPRYFWIEHQASGNKFFHFWPILDQDYEGYATIAIAAPAYPTTITATTAFDKFPTPMKRLIPDLVLAKIMRQYNLDGWEAAELNAKEQLVKIAPDYDTRGAVEWNEGIGTTDVYQDGYSSSRML